MNHTQKIQNTHTIHSHPIRKWNFIKMKNMNRIKIHKHTHTHKTHR